MRVECAQIEIGRSFSFFLWAILRCP